MKFVDVRRNAFVAPGVSAAAEGALTVLVVSIEDRLSRVVTLVRVDCMLASDLRSDVTNNL